jgi:hypothetical protein
MPSLASSPTFYYTPVSQACDSSDFIGVLSIISKAAPGHFERIVQIVVCGTLMPLDGTLESWINKNA